MKIELYRLLNTYKVKCDGEEKVFPNVDFVMEYLTIKIENMLIGDKEDEPCPSKSKKLTAIKSAPRTALKRKTLRKKRPKSKQGS